MKDLLGKFSALLLLVSAGFNIYIGVNVPLLENVRKTFSKGWGDDTASNLPLMMIFVSAGLYGVIGLILMTVKSIRSLNMLMAILLMIMAGGLSYVAYLIYPYAGIMSTIIDEGSEVLETRTDSDTANKYKKSSTAVMVYPAYASIFGAVSGFLGGILLFNRSS